MVGATRETTKDDGLTVWWFDSEAPRCEYDSLSSMTVESAVYCKVIESSADEAVVVCSLLDYVG